MSALNSWAISPAPEMFYNYNIGGGTRMKLTGLTECLFETFYAMNKIKQSFSMLEKLTQASEMAH